MDRRNKGRDPIWYTVENALIAVLWWLSRVGLTILVIVFLILVIAILRFEFY